MASSAMASGELYFAGERDPRTQQHTPYVKVGIVRSAENRSSADRMKEHQTGNPRELLLIRAIETPVVEQIETLMHGAFAPHRLSGEWFFLSEQQCNDMIDRAAQYVGEAQSSIADMEYAEKLKDTPANGVTLPATDDIRELHRRLVVVRQEIDALDQAVGQVDATIREIDSRNVPLGRYVSIVPGTTNEKFDSARFKKEHPDLWSQFVEILPGWTQRFTISQNKDFKAGLGPLRPEISGVTEEVDLQVSRTREDNDIAALHEEYLHILTILAPLEWEEKRLQARLKSEVGENSGIEGVCSWSRGPSDREKFDKKSFQESHPEIYSQFVSVVTTKPKLTIMRDRRFTHS